MKLNSVYKGEPDGKVTVDGRPLKKRFDIRKHSPAGFSWGYGGSGPAQLALAIMADFLEDDGAAQCAYQAFKAEVVARLPQDEGWELTGEQIAASRAVRESLAREVMES